LEIVTNVRRSWSALTLGPQRRDTRQPKRLRPIAAIDTETVDGIVWLIADSNDRASFPLTWFEVLEWLEAGELYRYTIFCWNLDYDARAILSLLDDNTLIELAATGQFTQPYFSLRYVPRKFLVIQYNHHRYEFFDLMQFFNSSLNAASKKYLGEEKLDMDARRISDDPKYRAQNRPQIVAYCRRDAALTARLGVLNTELYASIGVHSNKWYSSGYIASRYFLTHGGVPRYHFADPQRYAYYSYAGGRFECFQRGYFEDAYKYDITSAYPYVISTLPDLDRGQWVRDTSIDYDADLIFARARVVVPDHFIQPLHVKHRGVVLYPSATTHYRILTKAELEVINDFDLATVDVCEAWHFYADTNDRPFASIRDIFARRQELKRIGDHREYVLKKVMNSLYGKFIQVTTELAPALVYRVGQLFIPAYASEITSRVRMQLVRTTLEREMTPVAYFTDAILTTEPENLVGEGLGTWNLETSGELLLLGCGVYAFRGDTKTDTHMRGFESLKGKNLFDLVEVNARKSHIDFSVERPISLGEYAQRSLAKKGHHLNEWMNRSKSLDINFDRKRTWEKQFVNCADTLHGSHLGVALKIDV
jgi:hypothetical protein